MDNSDKKVWLGSVIEIGILGSRNNLGMEKVGLVSMLLDYVVDKVRIREGGTLFPKRSNVYYFNASEIFVIELLLVPLYELCGPCQEDV